MGRLYAIQHRTTKMYLGVVPSLNYDPTSHEPPALTKLHVKNPVDAARYVTKGMALQELDGLGEFSGAYRVKSVQRDDDDGPMTSAVAEALAAPRTIIQTGDFD